MDRAATLGRMEWAIDPDTMKLTNPEGRLQFARADLDRQVWPPCPTCGGPIEVKASFCTGPNPLNWLVGPSWQCMNGHGGGVSRP